MDGSIKEACIIEGAVDKSGHCVEVTIMKGGKSINGYFYNEKVLQSIARLVEGAHAYADHGDAVSVTRSMRDLVGFYEHARYIPPASGQAHGQVKADLHILEAASWLWSMIVESQDIGKPDLIGLSIDIFGHWQHDQAQDAKVVTRVIALNSCDVVARPSAGGSIDRILHSNPSERRICHGGQARLSGLGNPTTIVPFREGEHEGSAVRRDSTSSSTGLHTNTEGVSLMTSVETTMGTNPMATTAAIPQDKPAPIQIAESVETGAEQDQISSPTATFGISPQILGQHEEALRVIRQQHEEIERLLEEGRIQRAQLALDRRLQESVLPAAVRKIIRERYAGRVFEEDELERDMQQALEMMAHLTRDGIVHGHGYDKVAVVGAQITEAEKVQAAFDKMFDLDIDARLGNIRAFTSIREAYARVTGESSLLAGIRSDSQLGLIAIHESAPIARITEADTTTASFSYLLGTSMNKRLLKDYQAWPAEWMKFCTIAPIRDFKQQARIRLGAFGSLSIVPEDTLYTTVTLTDSSATYVPQKRGNIVTVSRETIINDDLQGVKQLPTKLAVAAAYTLAEFVYGFLSNNPSIYDSSNLFTVGAPHNNLGTVALSTAAMQSGVTAMRGQTNYAGKRLGLRPKFLVVPPELEFTSMVVTKSAGVPGSNNNDINPMLGYVTPIVSAQLSHVSQWFLIGDPREIDTIEIGFVGGQVNPALFIQDQPLFGSNFTQDSITYKIRHEYGGAVVDYRGLYRGI